MGYPFFILFAIFIASSGLGAWALVDLGKKVRRLYGEGEFAETEAHAEIVRRLDRLMRRLDDLEPRLHDAEGVARASIHKVGFVRFNPFQDTGGDNSFVLVLLDADATGVMISSQFRREGVRVYGKAIDHGRSKYPLSQEEQEALSRTIGKQ